jgi:hypothetical protein
MPPAPAAPWYMRVMMGLHTPSSSFCLSSNSSTASQQQQQKWQETAYALVAVNLCSQVLVHVLPSQQARYKVNMPVLSNPVHICITAETWAITGNIFVT